MIIANPHGRKIVEDAFPDVEWTTDQYMSCHSSEWLFTHIPEADPLCCLLEDDKLISDFSIRTGRLLGKNQKQPHDVRIQADVTIKVLRVMDQNLCLVGD
jgi:hypothetical protein